MNVEIVSDGWWCEEQGRLLLVKCIFLFIILILNLIIIIIIINIIIITSTINCERCFIKRKKKKPSKLQCKVHLECWILLYAEHCQISLNVQMEGDEAWFISVNHRSRDYQYNLSFGPLIGCLFGTEWTKVTLRFHLTGPHLRNQFSLTVSLRHFWNWTVKQQQLIRKMTSFTQVMKSSTWSSSEVSDWRRHPRLLLPSLHPHRVSFSCPLNVPHPGHGTSRLVPSLQQLRSLLPPSDTSTTSLPPPWMCCVSFVSHRYSQAAVCFQ